jgi:hypothetical protein
MSLDIVTLARKLRARGVRRRMFRIQSLIAMTLTVVAAGCVTPERQVSDLRAPAAPRLTWQAAQPRERSVQPKTPLAQDLVIREHRFVSHSDHLNSDGEDQVQRLAGCLRATPAKIVIEPSGSTAVSPTSLTSVPDKAEPLDLQRRRYVIQKLLTLGIPDAETRVVLQTSPAA